MTAYIVSTVVISQPVVERRHCFVIIDQRSSVLDSIFADINRVLQLSHRLLLNNGTGGDVPPSALLHLLIRPIDVSFRRKASLHRGVLHWSNRGRSVREHALVHRHSRLLIGAVQRLLMIEVFDGVWSERRVVGRLHVVELLNEVQCTLGRLVHRFN